MKTAEEVIEELTGVKAGADRYTPMDYGECIQAMHAYAQAAIEEQLKVTAKETMRAINEYLELLSPGIGEEDIIETTRIELK